MGKMRFNLVIIGGGPGGYVAAIYAAKRKARVALIEKGDLGGTCLNRGCIPTKALIHSVNLYNSFKEAEKFGIKVNPGEVSFDWQAMQQNKGEIVEMLKTGVEGLLKANGVKVYRGTAILEDPNRVRVISKNEELLTTEKVILATGSVPGSIPIPGHDLEGVINSDEALSLSMLPSSLVIIGGGVIGIELGFIFNALGVEVTILEMESQILPRFDQEIALELKKNLENSGIKIFTETKARSIAKTGDCLKTQFEVQGVIQEVVTEKVLMAVGRNTVSDAFRNLGIKTERSGVVVDDYLCTNLSNIYAIGDLTGKAMLAHVASHQGMTAVRNALGEKIKMDYKVIPSCVYCEPQIATVGLTEQEAKELCKGNIRVGKFPFAASGKALTMRDRRGFVKVISDARYDEILGVQIIGPHATELIGEAALAIKQECTVNELIETIHAHPTLSEALMEASFNLQQLSIHIP